MAQICERGRVGFDRTGRDQSRHGSVGYRIAGSGECRHRNVKPASLTNGLPRSRLPATFRIKSGRCWPRSAAAHHQSPHSVVNLQTALRLTGLRDLAAIGVNVIVTPAAGNRLIAIDADGIVWVDDGGDLRVGQPDIEMSDTPTATSTAATVMVSTFQRNIKVVRSERFVNWAKRADAVAYLTLA